MMQPKILVTGANGFVGRALCAEAANRGMVVRGVTRSLCKLSDNAEIENIVIGDIDAGTDWSGAFTGCDTVIHLAARVHVMNEHAVDPLAEFRHVNVEGTERLARMAAASGVKRLVFVSSIKVNGEETSQGNSYVANDVPAPQDPYAVSKWEAEQALWKVARETGLEVVIVRTPLVYGPGVKGNFAQMLSIIERGIPLPFALVKNHRSLIFVGNLVDVLLECASKSAAAGQLYLVSDGEDVSTPGLLRHLGQMMGRQARLFPFPPTLLEIVAKLAGRGEQARRLLGSLQIDNAKICHDLNWEPPFKLQQGLRATAEWYRNQHT